MSDTIDLNRVTRAASTIEAYQRRCPNMDRRVLLEASVTVLDAYRSLVAERLPEPVVPPKEFGAVRGAVFGVALSSLFWGGLWWAVGS